MQRRVEQPDRHRQPAIASKMPSKSLCWKGSSRSRAARRAVSSSARIISWTTGEALLAEEHVLGAAEADALRAELAAP